MLPPLNSVSFRLPLYLLLPLAMWQLVGCAESVDPQIEQLRNQYLLNSPPTSDTSVSKVLKSLTESEDADSADTEPEDAESTSAEPEVTDAEPAEAESESAQPADAKKQVDVVIKGRIDAGDTTPWADGLAAFVITDATGHDGEADHNPHTCPFCSRNIKDYLAKVSFVNESDQLIEIDSRKLFDVREKQLVYITGTGTVDQDGLLNVTATGLYIPE